MGGKNPWRARVFDCNFRIIIGNLPVIAGIEWDIIRKEIPSVILQCEEYVSESRGQ